MTLSRLHLWLGLSALNGMMAVTMGALGAHVLEDPAMINLAQKASLYQLIHAGVLLALARYEGLCFECSRGAFVVGMICFSGGLYAKAVFGWPSLVAFAPFGGAFLILAWLLLLIAAVKSLKAESLIEGEKRTLH